MIKMQDVIEATSPVSLVGRYFGDTTPVPPPPVVAMSSETNAVAAMGLGALSGLSLVYAAVAIVGGIYFFKTAPKEKGFWKGWGYVNGGLSYIAAGTMGLAALGLGGAAIVGAVKK
jgi:hypothetical protein